MTTKTENGKLAVVLVRGLVGLEQSQKDTLQMLRLNRKNFCVVVDNTPVMMGMIKKVKDFITWGEINDDTYKQLVEKRGEEYQGRLMDGKKLYSYKTLDIGKKKY